MNLFNKIIILLLLAGFYAPAYSAVDGAGFVACDVYSEGDKKEGDKKEGEETEEEPDCE